MCGKYAYIKYLNDEIVGSPPRVWEVLISTCVAFSFIGITPTCVGSTGILYFNVSNPEDHPHVCGKYMFNFLNIVPLLGSPPRVWEVHGL